jgi:tRNA threonylcarbamoyladenosine biosynthesis protein TsaE
VHHFDLWRLTGPEALLELGWDDMTADIVMVEWPDRLGYLVPPGALTLRIAPRGETSRLVSLSGWSGRL